MSKTNIIIVGGGWAGLAAATRLAQSGAKVTLIEQNKDLGGRASSFYDAGFGEWLDNGPHLFIRAYKSTLRLLNTWGVKDGLDFDDGGEIPFIYPNGRIITLNLSGRKSGKLGSLQGLLSFKGMSIPDRLRTVRAASAMLKSGDIDPQHEPTVAEFLSRFGISEVDCGGFWDAITVAVMNAPARLAGLKPLVRALKEGLLGGGDAGRLGVPVMPFKYLFIEPAGKFLVENGVEILTDTVVRRITINDNDRVTGVEIIDKKPGNQSDRDIRTIKAEKVVIAIPPPRSPGGNNTFEPPPRFPGGNKRGGILNLLPDHYQKHEFFSRLIGFKHTPIAAVHLTFDKPVMRRRLSFFPQAFTHWLFGRGQRGEDGWNRVSAVISNAPNKDEMTNRDIERYVLADLRERLPEAADAEVRNICCIRTMAATVLLEPGSELIRPSVTTPIEGLYLAGDWVGTGLPATIESAVRAGEEAAEEVLKQV